MNMEQRITDKLESALQPTQLNVLNQSQLHTGHVGDNGSGESHFKIEIASDLFQGVSPVGRERIIYKALSEEMLLIHALSVKIL